MCSVDLVADLGVDFEMVKSCAGSCPYSIVGTISLSTVISNVA